MSATTNPSRKSTAREPGEVGSSKSLQKAIHILFHLGKNGPELGITQLASELHLNKATVHRLLAAMQKFDLIEQNPATEKYRLGLGLNELGTRALESRTLRVEAHGFLVELARRSNESASLAIPAGGGVVCLDRVDSANSMITVRTRIGERFPAHCTAVGKAVLAYLPEQEALAIISGNGLRCYTHQTLIKLSALMDHLEFIRRHGYAFDSCELEPELSGLAAPVFLRKGHLVGAIGIAGPSGRFLMQDFNRKVELVKDFAARLSRMLGRSPHEISTL